MKCILIFGFLALTTACTHSVHLVNFSDTRPYKKASEGRPISSHTTQFTVMGFTTETNYVNEAYQELLRQCPAGVVTGIVTKYYTDHGFFSWTNNIEMNGLCFSNYVSKN